jgi:hypothetical protein
MRNFCSLAGLVIAAAALSLAQDGGGSSKSASPPARTEIRLADGSTVHAAFLQEHVDVQTRYGLLRVPAADIRRIEFGLHPPARLADQIAIALKLLGSDVHAERDRASAELREAGHFARPGLALAAKSPDPEVARRAAELLAGILERTSPELLAIGADDVVHTAGFPVVGRIANPTLQCRSPILGALSLKLAELRTLHVRHGPATVELQLDAAKYGSDVDQWLETTIAVDPGLNLSATAVGQVDLYPQTPGQYVAGPKGYNAVGRGGTFMSGSLVGRIGENGKPFLIGERCEMRGAEGKLYLHITPSQWNTAPGGAFVVRIHTVLR